MTPHISAPQGAFAKTVLLAGDPLRAKFVAENYLSESKLVTSVRNIYGYTGLYKGQPLSVMGSGMGMPSIGIYSYELYKFYDVRSIIRIGSAGSYSKRLNVLDVVLAQSAYSDSTYALLQNGCTDKILLPSAELNTKIQNKAKQLGIDLKTAQILSSDVFYADENHESWQQLSERTQTECVEMEAFALFHNARALNRQAATLLTISDSFCSKQELSSSQRQTALTTMIELALEASIDD